MRIGQNRHITKSLKVTEKAVSQGAHGKPDGLGSKNGRSKGHQQTAESTACPGLSIGDI